MSKETIEALKRVWKKAVVQHNLTCESSRLLTVPAHAKDIACNASALVLVELAAEIRAIIAGTDQACHEPDRLGGIIAADIRRLSR